MTSQDPTDVRLAAAQKHLNRARRDLQWSIDRQRAAETDLVAAQARVDRAREKRDALDPVIRAHANISKLAAAVTELTEASDPLAVDLDADTRDAATQADEFFNRPGDYHQVMFDIPIPPAEYDVEPGQIGAQCVIKFTPEQKPLVVELFRQFRGALDARITITRLHANTDTTGIADTTLTSTGSGSTQENEATPTPQPAIPDGPPYEIGRDIIVGPRYGERERIAEMYGVPVERVQPANSPTGDTAWTIRPEPTPEPAGQYAASSDHGAAAAQVYTDSILTVADAPAGQYSYQEYGRVASTDDTVVEAHIYCGATTLRVNRKPSECALYDGHTGEHVTGDGERFHYTEECTDCTAALSPARADIYRAHNERHAHTTITTTVYEDGEGTRTVSYACGCGTELNAQTDDQANRQWDEHRRERFETALLGVHDAAYDGTGE